MGIYVLIFNVYEYESRLDFGFIVASFEFHRNTGFLLLEYRFDLFYASILTMLMSECRGGNLLELSKVDLYVGENQLFDCVEGIIYA